MILYVILAAAVFVLAWRLARWLTDPGHPLYVAQTPNERSLHERPTPHNGGYAILAGTGLGWIACLAVMGAPTGLAGPLAGLVLVVIISAIDDRRHQPTPVRLGTHVVAAILLVGSGFLVPSLELPGGTMIALGWLAWPLCVLGTVWMINLYNFMDGMDGFAGGMTVIGFATLACLATLGGHWLYAALAGVVAAAALGFLVTNFPPARIFMGDVGAAPLGFLAAAFGLWAAGNHIFPLWFFLLLFSPFIVDASLTLLLRALQGKPAWKAHRSHYYQRLVKCGWSHRRTVLWEYGVMLLCAVSCILLYQSGPALQWSGLLFWLIAYGVLALVIHRFETVARRQKAVNR